MCYTQCLELSPFVPLFVPLSFLSTFVSSFLFTSFPLFLHFTFINVLLWAWFPCLTNESPLPVAKVRVLVPVQAVFATAIQGSRAPGTGLTGAEREKPDR